MVRLCHACATNLRGPHRRSDGQSSLHYADLKLTIGFVEDIP